MRPLRALPFILLTLCGAAVPACDDDGASDTDGSQSEETEVITTVTLTFTAPGQDPIVASFDDPDGDGGASGTAEPIILAPATVYALEVEFFNGLQDPPESIGEEVAAEAEEHQVLLYGSSVTGPGSAGDGLLTHAYADVESDYGPNVAGSDLPVGLLNTVTTDAAGTGELRVMLRHLPELNAAAQKTPDLAMLFAEGGTTAGDVDADVRFVVEVR